MWAGLLGAVQAGWESRSLCDFHAGGTVHTLFADRMTREGCRGSQVREFHEQPGIGTLATADGELVPTGT
jgi:hypothetical protein